MTMHPSEPGQANHPSPSDTDLDERQALRGIRRRISYVAVIATVFSIFAAAIVGYLFLAQRHGIEEARASYARAQQAESTEAFLAQARELLPRTDYDELEVEIIGKLGQYRDAESVPLLIEALREAGVVRRAAALALASIGLPKAQTAKPALLAVLDDTDARDRAQVVWALAVLRERAAAPAIIEAFSKGMLQAQAGFEPKVVVDAVGVGTLSTAELLDSPEPGVRLLVAQALAQEGSADVVEPLKRLLKNELARTPATQSQEVIRQSLAGLGRTRQPAAVTLFFEVLNTHPGQRAGVLELIRKSTAARGLIALIDRAPDLDARQQLVRMLAATHDPFAKSALAGLVNHTDAKVRTYAAVGLAELGDDRGIPVLIALAGGDNDNLAMEALDHLRALRSPTAAQPLMRLIAQQPGRRASILRALGASGSLAAGPLLLKALKGDDVEAAALALGELRFEPAFATLLRMVKRPAGIDFTQPSRKSEQAYRNRLVAIQALGFFGKPAALPELQIVIEDTTDDARLRDVAGRMVAHVAEPEFGQNLVAKVRDTALDERARVFYAQAFWQRPMPPLAPALLSMMSDVSLPAEIRRAAALGMGYIGDSSHDAKVAAMLEHDGTREAASFAAVLGGDEVTGRKLLDVLIGDRSTLESLEDAFLEENSDWFAVLPKNSTAQILRRLRVANILREGKGAQRFGFAWAYFTGRLKAGWPAPFGMDARTARRVLFDALNGHEKEESLLAAQALNAMGERGLLLRARDGGGEGAEVARRILYMRPL
ncbi:MAG: HEAT repeat domain-containing protein [Myxococcales bacterium]|nr:HEAT repeat domain-containing protein [Myxococcales bacterium]